MQDISYCTNEWQSCLQCQRLHTYRMKYMHLQWLSLDEFSMASNSVLRYMHLHLQDIKHSKNHLVQSTLLPFVTYSNYNLWLIISYFMDLRSNYSPLATNLWTEHFCIYELDEIMWQKDDRSFAELFNRLQIGRHTEEDLKLLTSCKVSSSKMYQLNGIPHFFPTRKMVADYNNVVLENSSEIKMTITAIDILPPDISQKVKEQLFAVVSKHKQEKSWCVALNYNCSYKSSVWHHSQYICGRWLNEWVRILC